MAPPNSSWWPPKWDPINIEAAYAFLVLALLIAMFGSRALRTPTDIFPNINIPVISVVQNYTRLLPSDASGGVIYYKRTLTSQVRGIEPI
jgi:multidrug efflux pump subunit AcrB